MSTTFIQVAPAHYVTGTSSALKYDCTASLKTILRNEVWKRGFDYGFSGALQSVTVDSIQRAEITITPLADSNAGIPLTEIAEQYLGGLGPQLQHLDGWQHNFLVTTIECSEAFTIEPERGITIESAEAYHRFVAVSAELNSLFKAAIQLVFHCDHIPLWTTEQWGGAGFTLMRSGTHEHVERKSSFQHTYPAILEPSRLGEFDGLREQLVAVWHKPLWSIHRYLKAIPGSIIEMEGLLDLLFALEGLYGNNTSSGFIRLSSAILCSQRLGNAKQIDSYLDKAFKIRNDIVHGSEHVTGLEHVKLSGGESWNWEIFWKVKTIVAGMIRLAVQKQIDFPKMEKLRITNEDVLRKAFEKSSPPR